MSFFSTAQNEKWDVQRLDVRVRTKISIFHARWKIRTKIRQMALAGFYPDENWQI
jgi:hypothetical protein